MSLQERVSAMTQRIVSIFGLFAMFCLVYLALMQFSGHDAGGVLALQEYDAVATVSCGTRSMGLVLRCNDTALLREVPPNAQLTPGHIYTYRTENTSIAHRYLVCTENCTVVVMKGDNNRVAETVPRNAVQYEVIGAYYDEH